MRQTKRFTIFAKGNLDLRDTLHSLWHGGEIRWNGINTLLREEGSDWSIRVRHETSCRSDLLAEASGEIPPLLAGRGLMLGTHSLAAQFSDALFAGDADAYVLSIQPDLQMPLARHRSAGIAFYAEHVADWPAADRDWLRSEFRLDPSIEVDRSIASLAVIVKRIRHASQAPILIYNVSSVIPGDTLHCHQGAEDALSTRIRRFNLALVELSQRTGISIIDVDRIVASHGSAAFQIDGTHLTPAGCRAVAQEVLRVLRDYGALAEEGEVR